jgi:hypothetical protein
MQADEPDHHFGAEIVISILIDPSYDSSEIKMG